MKTVLSSQYDLAKYNDHVGLQLFFLASSASVIDSLVTCSILPNLLAFFDLHLGNIQLEILEYFFTPPMIEPNTCCVGDDAPLTEFQNNIIKLLFL